MTTHALKVVIRAFVMFRFVHSSEWSCKLGGPEVGRYKNNARADTEDGVATVRVSGRSHRSTYKTPHDHKGSLDTIN